MNQPIFEFDLELGEDKIFAGKTGETYSLSVHSALFVASGVSLSVVEGVSSKVIKVKHVSSNCGLCAVGIVDSQATGSVGLFVKAMLMPFATSVAHERAFGPARPKVCLCVNKPLSISKNVNSCLTLPFSSLLPIHES